MSPVRSHRIEDDGDGFQVILLQSGQQVGCALFPDQGTGDAFELAHALATAWEGIKP